MSPKPDVSEERTAQIITAAMQVFAQQGLEKARMDDIASESGLSKGTLYLYFKSKDAIISAIFIFPIAANAANSGTTHSHSPARNSHSTASNSTSSNAFTPSM